MTFWRTALRTRRELISCTLVRLVSPVSVPRQTGGEISYSFHLFSKKKFAQEGSLSQTPDDSWASLSFFTPPRSAAIDRYHLIYLSLYLSVRRCGLGIVSLGGPLRSGGNAQPASEQTVK